MSERKAISPLLDGFELGASMGTHDGVTCYPAIKENTDNKYIVKIISIPASQVQLDALLLTGAYQDPADAMDYFKEVADGIVREAEILHKLGKLDGFLAYDNWQISPMENGKLGYEVCLVGNYKRSLQRYMRRSPMTHLEAVNLGLDLCQALAICRRAGYLFVDLKPSNVFISKGKEYRIGDLGFVPLDSMRFTSLPGKYRSAYSPRELQDDLKTLDDTVDTYAAGMILYQIYNDGNLPAVPKEPADPFPSPSNADYEIAEIIMKALSPNPEDRWHDPMAMGQALVSYMQRNTINNTPIASPGITVPVQEEPVSAPEEPVSVPEPEAVAAEDTPKDVAAPAPEENDEPESMHAAVAVADPPAEVDEDEEDFARLLAPPTEDPEDDFDFLDDEPEVSTPARHHSGRSKGIIAAIVAVLILAGLGFGGFYFYQNHYLQTIDDLVIDGSQSTLTVYVETDTDESLLTVVCSDTYGNSQRQTLQNGQVSFAGLLPNSQYKVRLEISGFHKLVGKTTDVFNTESQTQIISFNAITGPVDGSVVLSFTADGAEPEEWSVSYYTDGEEIKTETFTGHTVTIRGLTVGKTYTFQLDSSEDLELLGHTMLGVTASSLIMAENLTIVPGEDNSLTVRWNSPEDKVVENWSVRCYNDSGYEEQFTTEQTEVSFSQIDSAVGYTVEVTANGMTQPARVSITANPLTMGKVTVKDDDPEKLTVSWDFTGNAPEGGWLLMYCLDDSETPSVVKCETPTGVIEPRIHGATYTFTFQAVDSTSVFNNIQTYTCPNAQIYNDHALSAERITAHMLKTPEKSNWSYADVNQNDYADTFHVGDKLSLILQAYVNFYIPEDEIRLMYVIRDGEGNVIPELISQETRDWKTMWLNTDYHYCELDIPNVPTEVGNYSLSLYFNGKAVMVTNFSIVE